MTDRAPYAPRTPVLRRPRGLRTAPAVLVLALVLASLAAGCSQSSTPSPGTSLLGSTTTTSPTNSRTTPSPHRVLNRKLLSPQVVLTASDTYVAWQVSPPGNYLHWKLARVDVATGRVEARRRLGAEFDGAVLAGGSLWVAVSSAQTESLLGLNPRSLAVIRELRVGGAHNQGARARGSVVAVHGGLWASAGGESPAVLPPAGQQDRSGRHPGGSERGDGNECRRLGSPCRRVERRRDRRPSTA